MADDILEILVGIKDVTKKGAKGVESSLKGISALAGKTKDAIFSLEGALLSIGLGAAFTKMASEVTDATGHIITALGVTEDRAREFASIADAVYAKGFATSVQQAADVVIQAYQAMGDIGEEELQRVANNAIAISDAFGDDTQKVISASSALMEKFGLTSQQAFDFITAGYQKNLNQSGDFLESITEYSVQFQNADADASQFFSALETGLQTGILGTDKASDSFKTFRINVQDGSKETAAALDSIGISSAQMTRDLASGATSVTDAYTQVVAALSRVEDRSLQTRAGAELLGSQFEDLGNIASLSIDLTATKIEDLTGATDTLQAQYTTFGAEVGKLWKTIAAGLAELIRGQLSTFREDIVALRERIVELQESGKLDEWATAIGNAFRKLYEIGKTVAGAMVEIFNAVSPLLKIFIDWAPTLAAAALGSVVFTKGLDAIRTASSGLAKVMSTDLASSFTKNLSHVQASSKANDLLIASTGSLSAALTTLASVGTAAFVGWGIGRLISEMKLFEGGTVTLGQKVQQLYETIAGGPGDEIINNLQRIQQQFEEMKDFELPTDFADASKESLEEFNTSLVQARGYWTAYLEEQRKIKEEAVIKGEVDVIKEASAEIEYSRARLSELKDEFRALAEGVSTYEISLQQTEDANKRVIEIVKALGEEQISQAKKVQEEKLAAINKGVADEVLTIEQGEEQKINAIEESQEAITDIRVKNAETVNQKLLEKDIELSELKKAEAIRRAEEEIASESELAQQKIAIDEQYQQELMTAKTEAAKRIADEVERIEQEALSGRLERERAQNDQIIANRELMLAKIELSEAQGVITADEAAQQKTEINREFYQTAYDLAKQAADQIAETYGRDTEQYRAAIEEQKEAEIELTKFRTEQAEQANQLQAEAEQARVDAVADAFNQIMETISSETIFRSAELQKQLADIQLSEAQGVISSQEAAQQKRAAEQEFAQFKVQQATESVRAVIEQYGQESQEYQNAVAAKIQAEAELATAKAESVAIAAEAMEKEAAAVEKTTESIGKAAEASKEMTTSYEFATATIGQLNEEIARTTTEIGLAANSIAGPILQIYNVERLGGYRDELQRVRDQFRDLSDQAIDAGLKINLMNQSLEEATANVASRISAWEDFREAIAETSQGFADYSNQVLTFNEDNASAEVSMESLKGGLQEIAGQIMEVNRAMGSADIEAANAMAETVIGSYQTIYEQATEYLDQLGDEWESLYEEVEAINQRIVDIQASTEESIRDLRRQTMTEEEAWYDRKAELEETMAKARELALQGELELAAELYESATKLAEDLAVEVRDSSGETIISLEEATTTATRLMTEASNAAVGALTDQQEQLTFGQSQIQGAINTTIGSFNSLSTSIGSAVGQAQTLQTSLSSLDNMQLNIDFRGTASPERSLTETLANLNKGFEDFYSNIQDQEMSIDMSANGIRPGITATPERESARNLGTIEIVAAGEKIEVMGNADQLQNLERALRREQMIGV